MDNGPVGRVADRAIGRVAQKGGAGGTGFGGQSKQLMAVASADDLSPEPSNAATQAVGDEYRLIKRLSPCRYGERRW